MSKEFKWDQSIGTAIRSSKTSRIGSGVLLFGFRGVCSTWGSLAKGLLYFPFALLLAKTGQRSPVFWPKQPHVTVTDLTSHHLATKKTSSKSVVFHSRCCRFGIVNGYGYAGYREWVVGGLGIPRSRVSGAALGLFWCSLGVELRCDLDNKFLLHAIWWISHAQMNINTWRSLERWTIKKPPKTCLYNRKQWQQKYW